MKRLHKWNIKKTSEFGLKKIPFFVEIYIIMLLFIVVPFIVLNYTNTYKLIDYSENEIGKYANDSLNSLVMTSQIVMEGFQTEVVQLSKNKDIFDMKELTSYDSLVSSLNNATQASQVLTLLNDQMYSDPLIQSIYLSIDNSDYIIATNYGITRLQDCKDVNIVKALSENSEKEESRWIPRSIPSSQNTYDAVGKSDNVVSYIYNLNKYTTSVKGTIVINLYEHRFHDLVSNSEFDTDADTFIIDKTGLVISHKEPEKIMDNIKAAPYIQQIFKKQEDKGYLLYEDSLYAFSKDSNYDWIYVREHNIERLMEKGYEIRTSLTIMTIIITIAAIGISFLFIQRLSKPLNRLVRNLKSKEGIKVDNTRNEWYILEKAFHQITEQESNLKEMVKTSENEVRKRYITEILKGNAAVGLQKIDTTFFSYENFLVVIIAFDNKEGFMTNYTSEQRYYLTALLLAKCEKIQMKEGTLHGIILENKTIALIVNTIYYDSVSTPLTLKNLLSEIQNEMKEATDNTFSAGISGCHHSLKGITKSLQEANEALERRIVLGSKSIVTWNSSMSNNSNFYYPYQRERRILNYLTSNNHNKIKDEIKLLIQEISDRKDISIDNIYQIFKQLIGTTMKYLMESYPSTNEIFGDMNLIYNQVSSLDTLGEIESFMIDFYGKICEYLDHNKNESSNNYIDKIIKYIHTNYKNDINFEEMAETIGISYSHARKVMRDTTDTSLSDYLNKVRIEESKKLIRNSKSTFSEIAIIVGYNNIQSYTRYFKKFEGITLSEYKAKCDYEDEKLKGKE